MRPHLLILSRSMKKLFDILDVLILQEMLVFQSLIQYISFFFKIILPGFRQWGSLIVVIGAIHFLNNTMK